MNTFKHEELYRKKTLFDMMSKFPITMCGAGAIGSNLVDNLIRQGFKKISVIDFDRVEDGNRHTQIWSSREIGQLKVAALRNRMFEVLNTQIIAISKKLDKSNLSLIEPSNLVIDGFDNVPSRKLITDYCKEKYIDCLHIGLFQDYAEIIWNEKYRVPDEVTNMDICEYPLARNIILLAVAIATEILITYVELGEKRNFVITLKDFKISRI
jgi:predicted ThiF/HesA family dinucleotide-utilizing enzyme